MWITSEKSTNPNGFDIFGRLLALPLSISRSMMSSYILWYCSVSPSSGCSCYLYEFCAVCLTWVVPREHGFDSHWEKLKMKPIRNVCEKHRRIQQNSRECIPFSVVKRFYFLSLSSVDQHAEANFSHTIIQTIRVIDIFIHWLGIYFVWSIAECADLPIVCSPWSGDQQKAYRWYGIELDENFLHAIKSIVWTFIIELER